jgi:hypothetical protein
MTDPAARSGRPTPHPARVTLVRRSDEDLKDRQVLISLDGTHIATLLYNQEVTREVAPGVHRLRANNTLVWKTLEFEARPDEHLWFRVVNRAARGMLWMVGMFGVGPILVTLERLPAPPAGGRAEETADVDPRPR